MNGTGFPIAAAGPVGIAWCRHGFYVQLVCIFSRSCPYNGRKGLGAIRRKENPMARGQRKSIDEKIAAKKELIEALTTRMESEKRELEELFQEKRKKELEVVSDIITESGLEPEEVAEVLQQYLDRRGEAAS